MKAQSGIEYMVVIGFVTLAITSILISVYFYMDASKDKIKINQIEVLSNKIISSSEAIFYAGEPSKTTLTIYIPKGINELTISGSEIKITASTSSGEIIRVFKSNVPIQGTIPTTEGTKKVIIKAHSSYVSIN